MLLRMLLLLLLTGCAQGFAAIERPGPNYVTLEPEEEKHCDGKRWMVRARLKDLYRVKRVVYKDCEFKPISEIELDWYFGVIKCEGHTRLVTLHCLDIE